MSISDLISGFRLPVASGRDLLLWAALVPLLLLALWAGRRPVKGRSRAKAALEELVKSGGDSIFMAVPAIEEAVEIEDPLQIAPLLDNARSASASLPEPGPAPAALAGKAETPVESGRSPAETGAAAQAAAIPVRDLLLTWYEARGYRFKPVPGRFRPIEFELRHVSDATHGYAFAAVSDCPSAASARQLLDLAQELGQTRLVVASETALPAKVMEDIRKLGVRVFDPEAMRAEIERTDLRTAVRIVAVARGRHESRTHAAGTGAERARIQAA